MNMADRWNTLGSRTLFESPWFKLRQDSVELPDRTQITYTLVDTLGFAMVVPVLDDGRVILERIYRYTVDETVLECPSGSLNPGETPEQGARRELEEETGWTAGLLTPLGVVYPSKGISNERAHLFLASRLQQTGSMAREPTEVMELALMPVQAAVRLALSSEVKCGPSALALILAERKLRESGAL